MKKITLLILMLLLSFAGFSQVISEGFEGATFPPTTPGNWAVFQNGFGSNVWTINTTAPHTGTKAAQINNRQNIGQGNTSKDFLATPLVTIPANGQLRFWTRTSVIDNQGTKFQIRIASGALPSNQTDETAYTALVQEWDEDQLSATYNVYEEKIVNLAAFAGQSVYIAFVSENTQIGTGLSGDIWLVDDVLLVQQCLNPTGQTAGSFTTSSASLSWGNPSGAASWEIEVIPAAATPTGSGLVVNTNPYTVTALTASPFTPLQPGTSYSYYVRALCGVVSSQWVGPYTFSTATLGYTCSAPIVIPGTLPYITNSNTALYGNNITGPQGAGCAGGATNFMGGNDVVYSYTAPITTTINITMTPGSASSSIFVYSSCANIGVSCLAGVANTGSGIRTISSLPVTAGQTYYIVISGTAAAVATAYNLTIIANTCTNLAATFSVVNDCANGPQFFVRANVTNMGSATSIVATDNQASPSQTITAPGQVQFGPFPNGTNVTIHLENGVDANCFINSANQTQVFCPATNDLCSGAIPIACGGTATQTTVGATTTGAPTGTCGTTGGSGGLWYSYVGTGDVVTFSLCGSAYDTKIQVVTGACGTFTCVTGNDDFCSTQSQVTINSVLGINYYVYVFGYATASPPQGVFVLNVTCVPPPPPPANDNCATATVVPTNNTQVCQVNASGTTLGATPSTPATITPCLGTADDDVWFEFVATNTIHIINLTNIVGGTTNLNHILYSNTCGALTQMYCSDPNGSLATGLTVGATYKIRVYTSGSIANQTATFNVCITVPPTNDVCSGATFVPVNSSSTCTQSVAGTISGATPSLPTITAPCVGTADDDVWFQFTASNSYLNIALTNLSAGYTNLNHAVYSGSCTGLTQVYCSTANTLASVANNLVVGQTYYLRIWSNANTPQTTTFDVCITTPSTCMNSDSMCGSVNYGNTIGVTSLGAIGCLATSPNPKYFLIQVQTTGPLNYSLTQSSNGTVPNLDVDYAAWGPFTSQSTACSAISGGQAPGVGVPVTTTTGCSYSAAATETLNIGNAQAGQYYVVLITNYSGQSGTISFQQTNATVPGAGTTVCCPEAYFTYNPATYCKNGGPNPTAVINANSVAGIFSSSPGLVFVSNLSGEINLAASVAGNYVVTNTIAPTATCSTGKSETYTITIAELASATISYTAGSYCKNDNSTVTVLQTGTTGGIYSSSPLGGLSINPTTGAFNPSTSTTGSHTVTYTVPAFSGCPSFTTTAPVVITPLPIATFGYNPVSYCQNGSDPSPVYSGGGTAGGFTSSTGLSIDAVTGVIDVSASTPGSYIITNAFAAAGGCGPVSAPFTITITAPPTAGFSYQGSPFCQAAGNANPIADMFLGATGESFSSLEPGLIFASTTTGEIDLVNSTPGTYTVTNLVTGTNGCANVSASAMITITALPTAIIGYTTPTMYCNNDATTQAVTLSGTAAYTGGTFSVAPSGLIIDSVSGTITPNGSTPGDYTVTYTTIAAGGCGAVTSLPVTITITAPKTAGFSYQGSPFCQAAGNANPIADMFLGATGESFSSLEPGLIFANTTTGEIDLVNSTPGTYTVTNLVTGTNGCANISASAMITITALPTVSLTYNAPDMYCNSGATAQTATLNGTGAYTGGTYNVAPSGLIIDPVSGTITPNGSTPGTYDVTYTSAASGGCGAVTSLPVTITITAPPTAGFSYLGTPFCQASGNANPVAQMVTGATAQNFTSTSGLVFVDATTGLIDLANSTPGTYIVTNTVLGTGGCGPVTSLPVTITITAAPAATIFYDATSFCDNTGDETVNFLGTPGGTYSVSPTGLTIDSVSGEIRPSTSSGGVYTVTYTVGASGGCPQLIATTFVTIIPDVAVEVTEDCIDNKFTLTALPVDSSFDPSDASYSWTSPDGIVSGPFASPALIITQTGTYISSVTYNGCTTKTPHAVANTECEIQRGISPNGDDTNEFFRLSDAKKLEIFNRYGTEVYSYSNYTNQWHGQSNNGGELPDGTYFYVIERNSGEKKTGWIYINR
ncbi:gliding motility-associated C-terminal domain-containing protein [Flavobacterium sp. GT3R68]|uniref:T9SS type B sorting domain-containing protein n=1 Tax=Flavobacterium sp. GT3R68 TaxID=2594437 RepID=UPI000F86547A|nr:gliding motility-associated C-terminal domain-containing protein [Flavobacterium sp. GT3R68]RTY95843.1 gliding motility-associated C-terminal domain-containing protein [Flavobacterium sp. GSN2]TRW93615.1 gliding motility-associated C-terminal domain-containing protein [Flavobacterium sp. GT3R68]